MLVVSVNGPWSGSQPGDPGCPALSGFAKKRNDARYSAGAGSFRDD